MFDLHLLVCDDQLVVWETITDVLVDVVEEDLVFSSDEGDRFWSDIQTRSFGIKTEITGWRCRDVGLPSWMSWILLSSPS